MCAVSVLDWMVALFGSCSLGLEWEGIAAPLPGVLDVWLLPLVFLRYVVWAPCILVLVAFAAALYMPE